MAEQETENDKEKEKINIINSNKNQKIVFSFNSKEKPAESPANPKALLFVCLLCKRKFENEDKLRKHEMFSELHKVKFINKLYFFFIFYKFKVNAKQIERSLITGIQLFEEIQI